MKQVIKRIAMGLAALLVLTTTGVAIAVVVRQDRTFEAPYPDITTTSDPDVIARGRYLALGPAHCVSCHARPGAGPGDEPVLTGGAHFALPIGTYYAPNITPDPRTGIGRYTDRQLARALRHGVHPSGRAMLPFMQFADLSDADLTAVLSYLRSRPPVHAVVPAHTTTLLGRFARAFLIEPTGPRGPVPAAVAAAPTAAYGAYLTSAVAGCIGCHTRRDVKTGATTGAPFAGGFEMESHGQPGATFVTPNLTPDPATGVITAWTEDQFVARFRHGVATASPMPWEAFARMTDDDLRAIYRYLRTLPPTRAPHLPAGG